ncbi:hypothetical protein EXS74_01915 [Candidatus Woesearchaeota archaeon]|nr:hypothetical protein [Candidatus Woesearchaeota archaeon]
MHAWTLQNGIYYPENDTHKITCGDGILILGQEEAYRRRCRSLEEYIIILQRFSNLKEYSSKRNSNPSTTEIFLNPLLYKNQKEDDP